MMDPNLAATAQRVQMHARGLSQPPAVKMPFGGRSAAPGKSPGGASDVLGMHPAVRAAQLVAERNRAQATPQEPTR